MATESPPDSSEGSSASVDPADACLTDSDCLVIGNVLAASSHTLEEVASCVNLTKEDILEIEKDPIRVTHLDKMTLVVSKWKEANEELATLSEFLHALRSLNDNTLGERLQSARKEADFPEGVQEQSTNQGELVIQGQYVSSGQGVSYNQEEPVDPELKKKMQRLERDFAHLQVKVYENLKDRNTSEGYAIFFTSLVECMRDELPRDTSSIATAYRGMSLDVIFQNLSTTKAWFFLSFQVLADAVDTFGDTSIKQEVQRYTERVEEFRMSTKFVDFLRIWYSRNREGSLPGCEVVIAKLDNRWLSFTLQDVAVTEAYLAAEFKVRSLVFRLSNGKPGSVTIMWHVTKSVIGLIKEQLEHGVNLAMGNVQQLWIGKKQMFKAEPYHSLYHRKIQPSDPEKFWGDLAMLFLDWITPFMKVSQKNKSGVMEWFPGGKLNASALCIDRHMTEHPNKVALLWEKNDATHEEVTYRQLFEMTCKLANVLKDQEVKKGDRVVIYMPAMPLAVAAMLACARIGAVHCVVFSSFDSRSLQYRIKETKAVVVITANEAVRGTAVYSLKKNVDAALEQPEGCTQVRRVLVAHRTDTKVPMTIGRDFSLEDAMEKQAADCDITEMDSEDELFIMYTSGTAGRAKGIVHTHAGYLLCVATTHKYVFDYKPGDIFACVANLGWITGHSYVVYGPLCNGATSVLFEGTPLYPHRDHYWEMVERLKVTQLYTIPSVLKHLRKQGGQRLNAHNMNTLRTIGSVGEPLSDDMRKWVFEEVGKNRCTLIDTWWQTELGGIAITVECSPTDKGPAVEMKPFFGVEYVVLNPSTEQEISTGTGDLYLTRALPGMGRGVLGPSGCTCEEFSNIGSGGKRYFTKDIVEYKSEPGSGFRVTGRKDGAVLYKGVYLNTPEIESAVENSSANIQEAVVVEMNQKTDSANTRPTADVQETTAAGVEPPHTQKTPMDSERDICVYVQHASGTSNEAKREAMENVRRNLQTEWGGELWFVQIIEGLPKTPSGKVMRKVLRDRWFLQGEEVRAEEMEKHIRLQNKPHAGMPMISCY